MKCLGIFGGRLLFLLFAFLFTILKGKASVLIIWLIVFFKDVHLDEEKAFGKYKK